MDKERLQQITAPLLTWFAESVAGFAVAYPADGVPGVGV